MGLPRAGGKFGLSPVSRNPHTVLRLNETTMDLEKILSQLHAEHDRLTKAIVLYEFLAKSQRTPYQKMANAEHASTPPALLDWPTRRFSRCRR